MENICRSTRISWDLSAILEVLYRLTGGENWKAFMYLTALANGVVVYLLYKITDRLYHDQNTDRLVLLASMGCIQLILYSTFLYGIMLGLAFALGAFYALLFFLEQGKWRYAVSSGILIGISILVKNNYSIFLVALVLLLLYDAVKKSGVRIKKAGKSLAAILILIGLTVFLSKSLTAFYESRSGFTIESGHAQIPLGGHGHARG